MKNKILGDTEDDRAVSQDTPAAPTGDSEVSIVLRFTAELSIILIPLH